MNWELITGIFLIGFISGVGVTKIVFMLVVIAGKISNQIDDAVKDMDWR